MSAIPVVGRVNVVYLYLSVVVLFILLFVMCITLLLFSVIQCILTKFLTGTVFSQHEPCHLF